ncbi:MAG: hypothetical protein NZ521_08350, partial [Flammeovirgaceae bacterium]|nr:hypothetical protein [Flammeovirgaceae bacterium]MDW8288232.1 hypothetical protein [Flammeovirgaceae bacterium]
NVATEPICQASLDRYGFLLLAFQEGRIAKYDSMGNIFAEFSPERPACASVLEAWATVQIFAYYRDFQSFSWFNRWLVLTETIPLSSEKVGFVTIATPANDGNLWLFDQSTFSLKKYSPMLSKVFLETRLDLLFPSELVSPVFLREYQNQLYCYDERQGLLIFDLLGNLIHTIPITAIHTVGFYQHFWYYVRDNQWYRRKLYEKADPIVVALPHPAEQLLWHGNHVYLIGKNWFNIYRIEN